MAELTDGGSHDASRSSLPAGRGFWLSWALASVVGWVVGGSIGEALGSSRGLPVSGFVVVAVSGVMAGMLQWLALRRRVARAGWWVLASTVGWVTGGFLSGVFSGGLAGWATIGAVYGVITGAALAFALLAQGPRL